LGSPFDDLRDHALAFDRARGDDLETRRDAFADFVGKLSTEQRQAIRRDWARAPRTERTYLQEQICEALGGSFGPAAVLLGELLEDEHARIDAFPEPPPELPPNRPARSEDELTAMFVASGVPQNEAR